MIEPKEKKIALVTGSSSGLGRHIAKILCQKGLYVYAVARRSGNLLELKRECLNEHAKGVIHPVSGDLSDKIFRANLIKLIMKKEGHIDYLFNNAGFGRSIRFEKQSSEEIRNMFDVNVIAYQHLSRLVLPHMKARNSGRLIHTGSVVAFTPLPYFTTYNSTKSAVYGFNRSLRYELNGSKVTSTVVLPARMKTGFAESAYDCYKKFGKKACVENFNKIAGDPYVVARVVVAEMDKGNEVVLPTFKARMWFFMRYFGWVVDFVVKNVLGPKELKHLEMVEMDEKYIKDGKRVSR